MIRKRLKIYDLGFYEEALGVLTELTIDQGFLIALIGKVNLILVDMETKLRPLMGMRVGCLHTDIPGKAYLVRVLPEFRRETEPTTDQDHCCCEAI